MSEVILAAIVGGLIGIFGSLSVTYFDFKKWKKSEKINYLLKMQEALDQKLKDEYEEVKKRIVYAN